MSEKYTTNLDEKTTNLDR